MALDAQRAMLDALMGIGRNAKPGEEIHIKRIKWSDPDTCPYFVAYGHQFFRLSMIRLKVVSTVSDRVGVHMICLLTPKKTLARASLNITRSTCVTTWVVSHLMSKITWSRASFATSKTSCATSKKGTACFFSARFVLILSFHLPLQCNDCCPMLFTFIFRPCFFSIARGKARMDPEKPEDKEADAKRKERLEQLSKINEHIDSLRSQVNELSFFPVCTSRAIWRSG